MTQQTLPTPEELEPEGGSVEQSANDFQTAQPFADEDFGEFSEGSLGDYEFDALDFDEFNLDPESDEFSHPPGRPDTPADLTGRSTVKRGRQPTRDSVQPSVYSASRRPQPQPAADWSVEGYWDELELDLFDKAAGMADEATWSAALWEDYELLETLASSAATARSKTEAEGLAAAMVPLSLRLVPQVYRGLWPALPGLIHGIVRVTRILYRQRKTRPLIEILPLILENTVTQLARRLLHGRPVTQQLAAKILTKQTQAVLHHHRRLQRTTPRTRQAQRNGLGSNGRDWWDYDYAT